MTFELTFETRPDYLYVRGCGVNGRDTVEQYLEQVSAECRRRDCFRVLIDDRLDGPRLSTMDVFAIASHGSLESLGMFDAIACVDTEMGEMGCFAETVAVNRGCR